MITLEHLQILQKSANVLNATPPEGQVFADDVPAEIVEQYYKFHAEKAKFNEVLRKHGMELF